MIETAGIVSCFILAGLTVFQIALILGAPLGRYAWGGAHTVLPANLRIGSMVSIVLYIIFAVIIASKAEIFALFKDSAVIDIGIWIIAIYFSLGVFMNGISRSKPERNLMTPIALILATTTTLIALH